MIKLRLKKDLKRNILRGHPWVYREALREAPRLQSASLVQVLSTKGEPLAWAIFDPHNPIALRVLSLEKAPPTQSTYEKRFARAYQIRKPLFHDGTNAFRLFNGEGDLLPGVVCDVYNQYAVIQFDGKGPQEFWDRQHIVDWLLSLDEVEHVIDKSRTQGSGQIELLAGKHPSQEVTIKENHVQFLVDIEKGQKTGFFLDQRDNRKYLGSICQNQQVLNLFSYSGGFSIYAGVGGASKVTSVDLAPGALHLAERNWEINDLPHGQHETVCADVSEYLAKEKFLWDMIMVDPPSMAHSEKHKPQGFKKYVELFSQAARRTRPGGHLFVSSCSSHISFDDFFEIINQSLSQARRRGQILRVSGQGLDHPFPHIAHELRYLKFVHLIVND